MNSVEMSSTFIGMMLGSVLLIIVSRGIPLWAKLALSLAICIGVSFAIKGMALAGDRDMNTKDAVDILINNSISVFVIVGLTIAFISNNSMIGRAFESTIGYMWISSFNGLSDIITKVFSSADGTNYNYNIIVTQLFDCIESNGKMQFDNYFENFPFKGITVNNDTNNMNALKELVVDKRLVSEAMLIALATVVAAYIGYLPIVKPWVR